MPEVDPDAGNDETIPITLFYSGRGVNGNSKRIYVKQKNADLIAYAVRTGTGFDFTASGGRRYSFGPGVVYYILFQ